MDQNTTQGWLALVPTPIGNRGDMTFRAVETLAEADVIACEDTRHSRPLLSYYEIDKPLVSYHQHNEQARSEELLARVAAGEKVAVISDAGMPGISDPGSVLLQKAAERGLPYTVLPGPSASITAAVVAGLGDGRFVFWGFLPRKGSEREALLKQMDLLPMLSIIYEAPHRIRRTVEELGERWPERDFVVLREWTKTYEEAIRFKGRDAGNADVTEKGEFVLAVGPAPVTVSTWDDDAVRARLSALAAEGVRGKVALRQVVEESGRSRNEVYAIREAMREE